MSNQHETAILAGGCYWGMQDLIRRRPGIIGTRVGFCGGHTDNPTYNDVRTGQTGHAESIEIIFDPSQTSFRAILELFFQIHDPSTRNRQGNDVGSQYRSAIFFTNEAQRVEALRTIADVDASGLWPGKVVTEVVAAAPFFAADESHQDYLEKIPHGYTCHFARPNWVLSRVDVQAGE